MNPVARSLHTQLETDISEKAIQKQKEMFGEHGITVTKGDGLFEEYSEFLTKLVEPFPQSEDGSRFINAFCHVSPKLYVNISHLNKIFKRVVPGSLHLDEVGKTIDFGPLEHSILGSFTKRNMRLTLKNIRYRPGAELRPNQVYVPEASDKKQMVINSKVTIGAVNQDPALMKTELVADVVFGDMLNVKNFVIPVETLGDETTTELVIALPKTICHIKPDGTFAINNRVCKISELYTGKKPVLWVNNTYTSVIPFCV